MTMLNEECEDHTDREQNKSESLLCLESDASASGSKSRERPALDSGVPSASERGRPKLLFTDVPLDVLGTASRVTADDCFGRFSMFWPRFTLIQRRDVELRYQAGLTISQIAAATGRSPSTVSESINAANDKLETLILRQKLKARRRAKSGE